MPIKRPKKRRKSKSGSPVTEKFINAGIKAFFDEQIRSTNQPPDFFYNAASIYAFSGEKEKALDNLEKAVQGKAFFSIPFVKADPIFDSLRAAPRYQEILRKLNL